MIIEALNRYYDILVKDGTNSVPKFGYSVAKVGYALTISPDGDLVDVITLKEPGKGNKLVPREMIVPEQAKRAVNICPNFLCDNSTYVLGLDLKGKPERSKKAFIAFKEFHEELLKEVNSVEAKALLAFLTKWEADAGKAKDILGETYDDVIDGSNLVFRVDGHTSYIQENIEIQKIWQQNNLNVTDDEVMGQCLITGEQSAIARLHPSIKNVKGAQSSGASIVSFNAPSYESYGKTKSYNSPTSKKVAFAYTTVLNHMLSSRRQRLQIGDSTTVFWAESPKGIYTDLAAQLLNPALSSTKSKEEEPVRDIRTEALLSDLLSQIRSGNKVAKLDNEIRLETKFYILGLAPMPAGSP